MRGSIQSTFRCDETPCVVKSGQGTSTFQALNHSTAVRYDDLTISRSFEAISQRGCLGLKKRYVAWSNYVRRYKMIVVVLLLP